MVVGVGTDLLEVARVARELARDGRGFVRQVFSPAERGECEAQRFPARHYAARFAAKEALVKALAPRGGDLSAWREVEVRSPGEGSACVVLHGAMRRLAESRGVRRVWLSTAHTAEVAAAGVILES